MPGEREQSTYERAMAGEPVLDRLLAENLPNLRAFVRAHLAPELRQRESASDVVQSVCRELLGERSRFEFRSEAEFRAWLFLAATNKITDKQRFHQRQQRDVRREQAVTSASDLLAGYASICTPSHAAMAAEQVARLEQALDRLEPDHREVIALTRLAGLPSREAAAVMGRSDGATRMLLGRALIRLAEELRGLGLSPSVAPDGPVSG
jgi:RNA polymerase sigma-70 factor (subfamily 1)